MMTMMRPCLRALQLGNIPPSTSRLLHAFLALDAATNYSVEQATGVTAATVQASSARDAAVERRRKKKAELKAAQALPPSLPEKSDKEKWVWVGKRKRARMDEEIWARMG